jgi:hypothetical protein
VARDTYATVTALIRQIIDDRDQTGGVVWADPDLLPFVNEALRDLFEDLANAGSMLTRRYFTSDIAVGETNIDFTTNPVTSGQFLPADFVVPLRLWEKLTTDSDRSYTEMDETADRLPDYDASDRLRFWMYTTTAQGPTIQTLGALSARRVRVLYQSQPTAFAQATDIIPYPGAANVLATSGLHKAALARGEIELATYAKDLYDTAWDRFKRLTVKGLQWRGRRRLGYGQIRTWRF